MTLIAIRMGTFHKGIRTIWKRQWRLATTAVVLGPLSAFALDTAKFVLGDQEYLSNEAKSHWAFQPVVKPAVPAVTDPARRVTNPVDAFIRAKQVEAGLKPLPAAEPAVLVRRLFFDLTGLPPTAGEIEEWTRGWSEARYAELVDNLLASPHYGERWGRYWLDLARYADTKGYMVAKIEKRYPFAYTYRDWVVQAFNDDMPYDVFIKRQIAADLMLERGKAEKKDLAALGFLTVGSRFDGNSDLVMDDRIDVVTRGMLGLTVSCARCHDHMFDPVPTADYYSLYGVFSSSPEPDELPQLLEDAELNDAQRAFQEKRAALEAEADDYLRGLHTELRTAEKISAYLRFTVEGKELSPATQISEAGKRKLFPQVAARWVTGLAAAKKSDLPVFRPWHAAADLFGNGKNAEAQAALRKLIDDESAPDSNAVVAAGLKENLPASLGALCDLYGKLLAEADGDAPHADEAREALRQVLRHPAGPTGFPWPDMVHYWDREVRDKYRGMESKVQELLVESPEAPPRAMVVAEATNPADTAIFVRGNPSQRGEVVPRRFLGVLEGGTREAFTEGSGRLELAGKIAAPSNPLTARVMMNRVWQQHFGTGLVETPSDFGLQTDEPLHRELLDWLAARFVEEGWSMKVMHRLLVTSSTYRQASGGFGPGGGDNLEKDPANRYWTRMDRRRLDYEATRDALLAVSGELDRSFGGRPEPLEGGAPTRRRAIYGFIDRYAVPPMMRTFDFADPNLHAPTRSETTVPQQALFFMNSPFVESRGTAVLQSVGAATSAEDRVRALYRRVLAREPEASEVVAAVEFAGGAASGEERWLDLAQALLASNEFTFVD